MFPLVTVRRRPPSIGPRWVNTLTPDNDPPSVRLAWTATYVLFSIAAHLVVVVICVLIANPKGPDELSNEPIDVFVEPPIGALHGTLEGVGLGSHVPTHVRPAAGKHQTPQEKDDPNAIPTSSASAMASASAAPTTSASAAPIAAASGSADPSTPVGSANVAPAIGSPDGVDGGTGPVKPRMTPAYAGLLGGWFGSRVNVLGLDPEELRHLSVLVSISISPDRRITSFSLNGSSGNAAYDLAVRNMLAGVQGSGTPLPEPPDGSTPPSSFAVRFRPLNIR